MQEGELPQILEMPVFKDISKNIFPEMSALNSNKKAFGVCEKNFYSNPIFN